MFLQLQSNLNRMQNNVMEAQFVFVCPADLSRGGQKTSGSLCKAFKKLARDCSVHCIK